MAERAHVRRAGESGHAENADRFGPGSFSITCSARPRTLSVGMSLSASKIYGTRLGVLAGFAGDRVSFGGEGLARLRNSRGCARRRPYRGVPEEVLADPLFADVEDGADLVEGAAEFSEMVSGAFAAGPRGLAGEGGAGFV
jgi:hypothetical protein